LDKNLFKSLFDRHFDPLRRFLYYRCADPDLATDIAQDTFMRIWEKQLAPLPGSEKALLYKIANDLLISSLRKKKTALEFAKIPQDDRDEATPEQEMAYQELKQKYEKALDEMPENQRVVFLMNRMDGENYSEIAQRLSLSVKAIEKRMSKALAFLRQKGIGLWLPLLALLRALLP